MEGDRGATCTVCGQTSNLKCSACERIYYCGKQHQKKDWKKHAKDCRPFKLAENCVLGRHYVAARNIKVGEIVLRDDQPLLAGPMDNCVPLCLGCYTVLKEDIAVPCAKCGWPLCNNCKEHGLECNFTSSRRDDKVSISEFGYPHPSYQCINVIKALAMKSSSPERYEKLVSLESHGDLMKDKLLSTVRFVKRFFKAEDVTEEEMIRILGILQVNGHEVPLTEPPYVAVYELASLLEHNCRANCSKSFTDTGGLIIHAAVPIAKGEHITICYTDPLWGTANRIHHLSKTKFFQCTCDRCKDPTEFRTMFDALKCGKANCSGYALPKSFLEESEKDYACNACKSITPHEEIEKTLENIGVHLSSMKKHDVAACKEFLGRYKNILHENHFYNVDVIVALSQLIGQQAGGLTATDERLLIEKIELCKKLHDLLQLLVPAENRIRGLILFELHAALAEFSRRHAEGDTLSVLLQESRKCLSDSYRLLKYEPKDLPEGKIAAHAEKNVREMDKLLKRLNVN